jgi:hypothetical protein
MVEFFFSIGVLVVIGLCFVGLMNYSSNQDAHSHHLFELYYGEPYKPGYHYSHSDIKKFFKENPEELKRREEAWQARQKEKYQENENKKKLRIKDRIFAYDYEDTLFEIFAPYAKNMGGVWTCDKWLPKEEIISKISTIRGVSKIEAKDIFNKLEEHNVLLEIGGDYMLSLINTSSDWDIVSDTDMNLDKWIVKHQNNT